MVSSGSASPLPDAAADNKTQAGGLRAQMAQVIIDDDEDEDDDQDDFSVLMSGPLRRTATSGASKKLGAGKSSSGGGIPAGSGIGAAKAAVASPAAAAPSRRASAAPSMTSGSAGAGREVHNMTFDGRFQRLKEGLSSDTSALRGRFDSECDFSKLQDENSDLLGTSAVFQAAVKAIAKNASKITGSLKATLARLERSKNVTALGEESEDIRALLMKVDAASCLCKALSQTNAAHSDVIDAFAKAQDNGIKLSPQLAIMKWYHDRAGLGF